MSDNLKPILEASYKKQSEASADLGKLGYTYDPELSTMESKVFVDKKTGKPSVAFRGSTRVSDWLIEDPALLLGIETAKQRKAKDLIKKVESKYNQPTDAYGHSLGGFRAETTGAKGNIYTYNKGVGLGQIGKKLPSTQTDIRTSKDLVSLGSILQYGSKKTTLKSPVFSNYASVHGLSSLTPSGKVKSMIPSVKSMIPSVKSMIPSVKLPKFF
jgi:hypothetical protein